MSAETCDAAELRKTLPTRLRDIIDRMSLCCGDGRVIAEALGEAADEIDRLNIMLRDWVWKPHLMSGWDDLGCPPDYAAGIAEACEIHGVPVPEHIREAIGVAQGIEQAEQCHRGSVGK